MCKKYKVLLTICLFFVIGTGCTDKENIKESLHLTTDILELTSEQITVESSLAFNGRKDIRIHHSHPLVVYKIDHEEITDIYLDVLRVKELNRQEVYNYDNQLTFNVSLSPGTYTLYGTANVTIVHSANDSEEVQVISETTFTLN